MNRGSSTPNNLNTVLPFDFKTIMFSFICFDIQWIINTVFQLMRLNDEQARVNFWVLFMLKSAYDDTMKTLVFKLIFY